MTKVLASILVLLWLLAAPGDATERASRPVPLELHKTNVLSGSEPGASSVFIPRDVSVENPLAGGSDLDIVGSGRFVGFALVQEGDDPNRSVYLGGRVKSLPPPGTFLVRLDGDLGAERVDIPAGNYDLYILPGRGEATITLRLDELKGQVLIRPDRNVRFESATPSSVRSGNLYAAGADGKLFGDGLLAGLVWFAPDVHAVTNVDFCQSRGATPPDWRYLPGTDECDSSTGPGGGEGWTDYRIGTNETRLYHGSWEPLQSGIRRPRPSTYQQAVTVETTSLLPEPESLFVWLTY